jgi:transcriptional regulator
MYVPKHFAEPRVDVLHQLMRAHPLATLVTLTADGLDANHVPLLLLPEPGPFGSLRGHVARANPVWRDLTRDAGGSEVLAIFHGPDAYITPSWYASKAETGKVVPTWNYAVAHAHGALRVVDDPAWIRAQMTALTAQGESAFAGPWRPDDAPADYIEKLIGAVVGIEIVIARLSGKWKVSQNQSAANREGVVRGLLASGESDALRMARLVEQPRQWG